MTRGGCLGDVAAAVLALVRELGTEAATSVAIQAAAAAKYKGARSWQGSSASVYRALNHLETIGLVTPFGQAIQRPAAARAARRLFGS